MIYKYIKKDNTSYKLGIGKIRNIKYDNDDYVMIRPIFKLKNESYNFLKGIEILVSQGVDVFNSLRVLKNSDEYKSERNTIINIYKLMQNGSSFYDSLKKSTDLPSYYLTLIGVAELSGDIELPLREANRILERTKSISRKVISNISYPIFLLFISIIMLIAMSNFVLPMFNSIYAGFESETPLITKISLGIGQFLSRYLIFTIVLLFTLIIMGNILKSISIKFYLFIEDFKYNNSLFKKIRRDSFHELFFENFCILYSRIENTSEVLNIIANSEENLFLRLNLFKLDKEIRQGKDFVEIASNSNIFTEFSTALFTGVGTVGGMIEVSKNLSKYYSKSLDDRLEVMTKWASPIVTIFVGGIIAIMALGIVVPMFNLSSIL